MMPRWKQRLLRAYMLGTAPFRRWNNARLAQLGRSPLMILFYHRVADVHPNGWTISNQTFQEEVRYLQRNFELVTLREIQCRMRAAYSPRPAVHITFDDGYAENCENAIPFLIRERVPTTYFVTLRNAVEQRPFAHDLACGRPLRPNSIDELRRMVDSGIEIGGHTRTHPVLSEITDSDRLFDEVVTAGRELGELCHFPIRYFACPFGLRQHIHRDLFSMARDNGYEAVVSAYGGYNLIGNDAFHLQRIHGAPVAVELENWLTFDPIKVIRTQRLAMEFGKWSKSAAVRQQKCAELAEVSR